MSDQDLNPTIETPGVNEMLAGYLIAFLKAHPGEFGRQELRLTVDAVLAENAESDHDGRNIAILGAPFNPNQKITTDTSVTDINLGTHAEAILWELQERCIDAVGDWIKTEPKLHARQEPLSIKASWLVIKYDKLFTPVTEVNFSSSANTNLEIQKRLVKAGYDTIWDLTQVTEKELHRTQDKYGVTMIKVTLGKDFGVGLKPTQQTPHLSGPGGM